MLKSKEPFGFSIELTKKKKNKNRITNCNLLNAVSPCPGLAIPGTRFWSQTCSALLLLQPWQQLWHHCLDAIKIKQFGIVTVGTQTLPSRGASPFPSCSCCSLHHPGCKVSIAACWSSSAILLGLLFPAIVIIPVFLQHLIDYCILQHLLPGLKGTVASSSPLPYLHHTLAGLQQ